VPPQKKVAVDYVLFDRQTIVDLLCSKGSSSISYDEQFSKYALLLHSLFFFSLLLPSFFSPSSFLLFSFFLSPLSSLLFSFSLSSPLFSLLFSYFLFLISFLFSFYFFLRTLLKKFRNQTDTMTLSITILYQEFN
jgi:hypothetical protein